MRRGKGIRIGGAMGGFIEMRERAFEGMEQGG
jgi:hypothetical protein